MGGPMAGWLAKQSHTVTVWNRTQKKADIWKDGYTGVVASDPGEAVRSADFVFMCLGDDPDVERVFDQMEDGLAKGAIVVDHTTASRQLAKQLSVRCLKRGVHFMDAPVSGGQAGAENGKLTVMAGGDKDVFARASPVMQAYSANMTLIGPVGSGQLAKSVNQICIAGVLQGLAEGLHFAKRADLDIEAVLKAISGGAAQSWQMDNRASSMNEGQYDFGFAVDWMRKDLRIALETARTNGAQLPLTALVDQFYADVQSKGGSRLDTSSLLMRLETQTKNGAE